MLNATFAASADSAISYYGHSGDELEKVGEWQGKDAERLGLSGDVDLSDWRQLVRGKSPDGEKLAQVLREDRRCLLDVTISVNKPTAMISALLDASVRDVIEDANRVMMGHFESLMQTRSKGLFGVEKVTTASMISAPFYHRITRAREPGDHIHNTVIALTHHKGKWLAPEFDAAVRESGFLKAVFHNEVARGLRERGWETKATKDGFTVIGIPQSVCNKFSTGHNSINQEQAKREKSFSERIEETSDPVELRKLEGQIARVKSPKGRSALALQVRDKKSHDLNPEKLEAEWWARITPVERQAMLEAHRMAQERRGTLEVDNSARHLSDALAWHLKADSAVPERKLLETALRRGVGEVTFDGLQEALGSLKRGKVDGIAYVTSPEASKQEQEILTAARKGAIQLKRVKRGEKTEGDKLPGFEELHRRVIQGEPLKFYIEGMRDYRDKSQRGNPAVFLEDVGQVATGQQRPKSKLVEKATRVGKALTEKAMRHMERIRVTKHLHKFRELAYEPGERKVARGIEY